MSDQYEQEENILEDDLSSPKADRGAPPIGRENNFKVLGGVVFGVIAVLGIGALIYHDLNKAVPEPMTKAEEITFRIPNAPSSPQIVDALPPVEEIAPPDPLSANNENPLLDAQKMRLQEMAMQLAQARREQALLEEQQAEVRRQERLRSNQLILDEGGKQAPLSSSQNNAGSHVSSTNPSRKNTSDFEQEAMGAQVETVSAYQMPNLETLIPQGKMISGVLETAINSSIPGMTRAIVAENTYSFKGGNLLIPKGSHLIGTYQSAVQKGQNRIFIIWTRLIRPDGVSINIGSYGTDSLGRTGLSAAVDTHFLERFGSSILLSLIDTGSEIAVESLDNNDETTIAVDTGNGLSKSSEIALEHQIDIQPTLHVHQGARIKVFVGKDLDFSNVGGLEY